MEKINLSRRAFLIAGLASGFMALMSLNGFCLSVPSSDLDPIGPNANDNDPYKNLITGKLADEDVTSLALFAKWAIAAWGFTSLENYPNQLKDILAVKTMETPSYLSEYQSAIRIIQDAKNRFSSEQEIFIYLMLAERNGRATLNTRLGRARKFVFDEIARHLVANGGFRRFGLVNYDGFIHLPFTNPNAYRRAGK